MSIRKSPTTPKSAEPSQSPAPLSLTDKILLTVALAAGIAVTAYSEWQLALQVGIHPFVAPLFPVAVDVYVVASVRAGQGRDIAAALGVMGGCQVSAHLLTTHSVTASIPLVAAVSLLIPITVWRVHALAGAGVRPGVTTLTPEPTVNVTRAAEPPWKPATTQWALALQPPAVNVKPVSTALTPRPDVVTARVSPESEQAPKSPQKPRADEVVRALYDELGGRRPGTRHIADALRRHELACSDGTCREARKRVEAREPELKALPPA
ncbi:hypothetical protein [Streptomyces sp. NPDC088816]|uniref:hypothetical protein n=1 Tax=Streptomyces sp. NPDC088816 TaxID=3365906 RepID=UPI00381A9F30